MDEATTMIKTLLGLVADVEAIDESGATPLDCALRDRRDQYVELLLGKAD